MLVAQLERALRERWARRKARLEVLKLRAELVEKASMKRMVSAQDIANMINTSRETVTRALTALAQQGIVQKDSHRLIILKPDALQKLVQGS